MNKVEFLDELRAALSYKLSDNEIQFHINYYEEYLEMRSGQIGEALALRELGSPRLIAKTIINTQQLQSGTNKTYGEVNESYDTFEDYDDEQNKKKFYKNKRSKIHKLFDLNPWYSRIVIFIIIFAIIGLIFFVGRIVLNLFFTFGIPILIIYTFYKLVKNIVVK